MPSLPQLVLGFWAALWTFLMPQHVLTPVELLKGPFEVQGEITPIAVHCCAVVGSLGCFAAAVMWHAVFTTKANRQFALFAMLAIQTPIAVYIQITWPFNDPPPDPMKMEMPWPMVVLPGVTCLAALLVGEADAKSHDA